MDYSIVADKDNSCDDFFPEGLSNFLEQLPSSEYNSEVRQVSQILNINLDAFLIYDDGSGDSEEQNYWQDIDAFITFVESFIDKIAENKEYFKEVRYTKNVDSLNDQLHEVLHKKDEDLMKNLLDQLYANPDLSLPPDRGYLSDYRIVEDLNDLKRILDCYKSSGAAKIKLLYG